MTSLDTEYLRSIQELFHTLSNVTTESSETLIIINEEKSDEEITNIKEKINLILISAGNSSPRELNQCKSQIDKSIELCLSAPAAESASWKTFSTGIKIMIAMYSSEDRKYIESHEQRNIQCKVLSLLKNYIVAGLESGNYLVRASSIKYLAKFRYIIFSRSFIEQTILVSDLINSLTREISILVRLCYVNLLFKLVEVKEYIQIPCIVNDKNTFYIPQSIVQDIILVPLQSMEKEVIAVNKLNVSATNGTAIIINSSIGGDRSELIIAAKHKYGIQLKLLYSKIQSLSTTNESLMNIRLDIVLDFLSWEDIIKLASVASSLRVIVLRYGKTRLSRLINPTNLLFTGCGVSIGNYFNCNSVKEYIHPSEPGTPCFGNNIAFFIAQHCPELLTLVLNSNLALDLKVESIQELMSLPKLKVLAIAISAETIKGSKSKDWDLNNLFSNFFSRMRLASGVSYNLRELYIRVPLESYLTKAKLLVIADKFPHLTKLCVDYKDDLIVNDLNIKDYSFIDKFKHLEYLSISGGSFSSTGLKNIKNIVQRNCSNERMHFIMKRTTLVKDEEFHRAKKKKKVRKSGGLQIEEGNLNSSVGGMILPVEVVDNEEVNFTDKFVFDKISDGFITNINFNKTGAKAESLPEKENMQSFSNKPKSSNKRKPADKIHIAGCRCGKCYNGELMSTMAFKKPRRKVLSEKEKGSLYTYVRIYGAQFDRAECLFPNRTDKELHDAYYAMTKSKTTSVDAERWKLKMNRAIDLEYMLNYLQEDIWITSPESYPFKASGGMSVDEYIGFKVKETGGEIMRPFSEYENRSLVLSLRIYGLNFGIMASVFYHRNVEELRNAYNILKDKANWKDKILASLESDNKLTNITQECLDKWKACHELYPFSPSNIARQENEKKVKRVAKSKKRKSNSNEDVVDSAAGAVNETK